jgi:hypothetical protein
MTKHIAGNVHLRHKRIPTSVHLKDGSVAEGFRRYKNGCGCPSDVEPQSYVELMIRTSEGAGSSGYRRGWLVDWDQGEKGGLGQIVGYRIVRPGESQ